MLMSYRDPEERRARWHKNGERNRAGLRASYQRHREKRLAEKKAQRDEDPEKERARQRANYAKHKAKRAEDARARRRANAEKINAKARERYAQNKDVINERRKGYSASPEAKLLHQAKMLIIQATGMRYAEVPRELAEARAELLKITRWVRDQRLPSDRDAIHEDAKRLSPEGVAARAEGIAKP